MLTTLTCYSSPLSRKSSVIREPPWTLAEIFVHPEHNETRLDLDGLYVGPLDNSTDHTATASGWVEDGQGEVQEFLQQLEVKILSECEAGCLISGQVILGLYEVVGTGDGAIYC